ncbi:MAG: ABC transporter permease subunit [Verrucomicrobiota bacterium]|nr:ABC transporter permease subunit [Verrucomicrobiota bacterium]
MNSRAKWILPIVTGVVLLGLWMLAKYTLGYLLPAHSADNPLVPLPAYLLPGPLEVVQAFMEERVILAGAAWDTLRAAAAGFIAAAGFGFAIALLLGNSLQLRTAFYPWIVFFQMVPVIVVAPIIVIWIGSGITSVALITFMISFFPVVANTTQGLLSVEANRLDLFRLYNARWWQTLLLLRVPNALPYFFTGLQIASSLAVIGALTGEIFIGSASSTGGLGFRIIVYKSQFKIPALFATAFTACLLGFAFVGIVAWLRWLALRHWHESIRRKDV